MSKADVIKNQVIAENQEQVTEKTAIKELTEQELLEEFGVLMAAEYTYAVA